MPARRQRAASTSGDEGVSGSKVAQGGEGAAGTLAINRTFLALQEPQGLGIPWGNWIGPEYNGALRGDGTDLPVPEYSPEQAKQLLAQAGFPGFGYDWYVPWVPYFDLCRIYQR